MDKEKYTSSQNNFNPLLIEIINTELIDTEGRLFMLFELFVSRQKKGALLRESCQISSSYWVMFPSTTFFISKNLPP